LSIPLGWMYLRRSATTENHQVRLRHEVEITGPLRRMLGWVLGGRYRTMLVHSVAQFQTLSEGGDR
jgi:hypothetical protein